MFLFTLKVTLNDFNDNVEKQIFYIRDGVHQFLGSLDCILYCCIVQFWEDGEKKLIKSPGADSNDHLWVLGIHYIETLSIALKVEV